MSLIGSKSCAPMQAKVMLFEEMHKRQRYKKHSTTSNYHPYNMRKYEKPEKIGSGRFGRVFRVTRRQDQKLIALKIIELSVVDSKSDPRKHRMEALKRQEGKLLSGLSHPNIANFIDIEYRDTEVRLYMDYYKHQSLEHLKVGHLNAGTTLEEAYIWSILYQLSSALVYCHHGVSITAVDSKELPPPEQNHVVLHRDIKPANVFLASRSTTALDAVKLGDFGVGTVMQANAASTYVGTAEYLPPEIRSGTEIHNSWTAKCDIFSLGCTIFEMCNLRRPFAFHVVEPRQIAISIGDLYSQELQRCIEGCISYDPKTRLDAWALFSEARKHMETTGVFKEYQLVAAAAKGDLQAVKDLISQGADMHAALSTNAETALHKAVENGHASIARYILDRGASPAKVTKEGHNALHVAAAYAPESTRVELVRMLFKLTLAEKYDKYGRTPLHCAAAQDHGDVIAALKEFGVNVETLTRDSERSTSMHIAAENGCEGAMRQLVECGASITGKRGDGATALHIAAKYGQIGPLLYCLSLKVPQDSTFGVASMTAMHVAALSGHVDVVLELVRNGADRRSVTKDGDTCLHLAAARGRTDTVAVLLTGEHGYSTSSDPSIPKQKAPDEVGKQLLKKVNKIKKETALHTAVRSGQQAVVNMLLDFGSDCNAATQDGDTSLHLASAKGYTKIIERLLDVGARVDARALYQNTPLHYAAFHGHETAVESLLHNKVNKANVNEKTARGDTILHIASERGNEALVVWILQQPDLAMDNVNRNGETALHLAAAQGHEPIIRELLSLGVDTKKRDNHGLTARKVAELHSHKGCAMRLRRRE